MYFLEEEAGQGLVEYALLLVFVSIVVVFALAAFGSAINSLFNQIVDVF